MSELTPLIIVSGYLGAGKTTFLREVIPQLVGSSLVPYVILNDFSNAEVDSALLREVAPQVEALSGGCICCDSSKSLIDNLEKIPTDVPAIVFIEANGTSDPYPLIEMLSLDPALAARFGPIEQVTIINQSRWQKRLFPWDKKIERAQAATASYLISNRGEKASAKQSQRVLMDLEALNPLAIRTTAADFIQAVLRRDAGPGIPQHPAEPLTHAHHHLAVRIALPAMREDLLRRWLRSFPAHFLRIKGVVRLLDDPLDDACFFQRTDDEFEVPCLIKTFMPEGAESCAVFIGNGLDEQRILRSLETFSYTSIPAETPSPHGIPSLSQFLAKRCK